MYLKQLFHNNIILEELYNIMSPLYGSCGSEISVNLCNASPFSRHIAIGSAGPASALQPMGAKQFFRHNLFNIGLMHKQ